MSLLVKPFLARLRAGHDLHSVVLDVTVLGDENCRPDDRLGDQQMIERILMVRGQGAKVHEVRRADGKHLERLCLDLLGMPSRSAVSLSTRSFT